jgi:N6-adenosine-specific RNA methylase IME4
LNYGPATGHYPPMSITALTALDIKSLALDNAVLFLWATSPLLPEGLALMKAWGFEYKASFIWNQVKHNFGHYNSVRHELLLLGTRGSCLPDNEKLHPSVVTMERSDNHSEKPSEFRDLIDSLYPRGERIELFARGPLPRNWQRWGADVAPAELSTPS